MEETTKHAKLKFPRPEQIIMQHTHLENHFYRNFIHLLQKDLDITPPDREVKHRTPSPFIRQSCHTH